MTLDEYVSLSEIDQQNITDRDRADLLAETGYAFPKMAEIWREMYDHNTYPHSSAGLQYLVMEYE